MTTQRWFVYGQSHDPLSIQTLAILRYAAIFGEGEPFVDQGSKTRITFITVQALYTIVTCLLATVCLSSPTRHSLAVVGGMLLAPLYIGIHKLPYSYARPAPPTVHTDRDRDRGSEGRHL
jgi:hypothetical protein